MITVGVSKKDTKVFEQGLAMFGYGDENHLMKEVDLPIYVRTFVIKQNHATKIALVVIELAAISDKLKKAVSASLKGEGYQEKNIMISATHTHSAPGGHFGYLLYDLTAGGFKQSVFDKLVNAIVCSIKEADQQAEPASIHYAEDSFEPLQKVVFNASLKAYNANPEVTKYSQEDHHLATDRAMSLLYFKNSQAQLLGSINWFGVHTTSIGKDHYKMSSDNKGYAAKMLEEEMKIVAAFAQKPCADTSPNFRWNAKRNKMCGKFDDDFESAKYNGRLQYEKAKEIIESNSQHKTLKNKISSFLEYVDLSNTHIDSEFIATTETVQTAPAALGAAFARGMTDGFGVDRYSFQLLKILSIIAKLVALLRARLKGRKKLKDTKHKFKWQGNKAIFLETTHPSIFHLKPSLFAYTLSPFDKMMRNLKWQSQKGNIDQPWTPHLLPIQLIIMDSLAICGVPSEISIIAGKRLQQSCLTLLKEIGVKNIVIAPYTNSYAGYITTPEEYEVQAYEGGHTMFGKYTFLAYQTHFKNLCLKAIKKQSIPTIA